MKILTNIGVVILTILTLVSMFVIGYSIYYFRTTNKLVIDNLNVNNLTYLDPKYGKRFPFEVNMYTNKNNNGIYCYELLVNTYTNSNIPNADEYKNVYSAGVQILNGIKTSERMEYTGFLNLGDCYSHSQIDNAIYYNTDIFADKSYSAIQSLNDFNGFIFDSSGILFTLKPGKDVKVSSGLWITAYQHLDINNFIIDLEKSVASLEDGEFILQFNLTKYFTWALTSEDNTSDREDNESETIDFTMFNIKINKSSNGLIRAEQSMFKKVNNDKDFSLTGTLSDYGNTQFNYYLNEFNFSVLEDNSLVLKQDITDFINSFKSVRLVIDINLDSIYFRRFNVVGFAKNAFNSLPFKKCSIISKVERTFNLNGNIGNFIFEKVTPVEVA